MSPPVRLRLQHRIVIPFALATMLAVLAAGIGARSLVADALEARVRSQVVNASAAVGRSDFALNAAILRSVKATTGVDVITFAIGGGITATTFDAGARPDLVEAITRSDAARAAGASASDAVVTRMVCADVPCYVAFRRVSGREDLLVAVVAGMADVAAATAATTRAILVAMVASLTALLIVSQVVARRVTKPIDRLVEFTRDFGRPAAADARGEALPRSPLPHSPRAVVSDDEIGRLAATFNDMLERLDRSGAALVRSEKLALAGMLAARIAHDIRNPMSSIKMQAQLLKAQLRGDDDRQAALDAILRDIAQVESVIRDLLELARPGDLDRRRVPLREVVTDALVQMAPQLTYRKIDVTSSFDAPVSVSIDVARFRQAFTNLVINAAESMPTGGTIAVSIRPVDKSTVALDVCDDGTGIPADLVDKVFDPFVSTKRDGVGLGLVNAKAIVESHGGRVELTPISPRGTRARVLLPVVHG